MLEQNTATCTQKPKVEITKHESVNEIYEVRDESGQPPMFCVERIMYVRNTAGTERLDITFHDNVQVNLNYSQSKDSTKERLRRINPEAKEKILETLSPEAKSLLERVLK